LPLDAAAGGLILPARLLAADAPGKPPKVRDADLGTDGSVVIVGRP